MSSAATAKPVVLVATLIAPSCLLSGCLLSFGPSHSAAVQGKTTTTEPPEPTTTAEPTTTTQSPQCDYDTLLEDVRPQAAPLVLQTGKFTDEGDCCNKCHESEDCQAWTFFYPTTKCYLLPNKAVWSAPSGDQLFIGAMGYIVGFKASKACDGCTDEWGGCGRDNEEQSWWKDCTICDDPDKWSTFPCFLPEGCKCGGDRSPWYPPEPPCECEGEPDCDCDGDGGDGGDGDGESGDGEGGGDWNPDWQPVSV